MIDFLVIGAQKCATSWLYYCLKDHPEIHLPPHKKEFEYIGGELFEEKGLEWYLSKVDHTELDQKVGDFSVEYLYNKKSPKLLHELFPDLKLIALLRHPVDRAISAYNWNLRRGLIPDTDINKGIPLLIDAMNDDKYNTGEEDELLDHKDILERGLYSQQLSEYLKFYDKKQILIIFFEQIKTDPEEVVKKVSSFLNVNAEFTPRSLNRKPKKDTNIKALHTIERLFNESKIISSVLNILHRFLAKLGLKGSNDMAVDTQKMLSDYYKQEIEAMGEILPGFCTIADIQNGKLNERKWWKS